MPQSRRSAGRRHTVALREASRGGVILGGLKDRVLRVRDAVTGRIYPCCLEDCRKDGDQRHQVQIPHEDPRWRDEVTGKQEMKVYIFCSEGHKTLWVAYYKRDKADR